MVKTINEKLNAVCSPRFKPWAMVVAALKRCRFWYEEKNKHPSLRTTFITADHSTFLMAQNSIFEIYNLPLTTKI